MKDSVLSVKDLTIDFLSPEGDVRAVDTVSFDIPSGKTMGLVGESGSGKSVTAFSIMRLIPQPPGRISNGQILFENKDLATISEEEMRKIRGNKISMIFQEPMTSLNPVFTVGDQVAEVLQIHKKLNKKQALDRAIELMHVVGIPNPKQRSAAYPHELSGGQKQRIMIAMAIANEPKLLIADEPTTALDVTIQKQVLDLMLKLQQTHKMSMLFITHDLGVIADIADDVAVMYRSKIVEKGSAAQIFKSPAHPYTKGLLNCRPKLGDNPKRLLTVSDFMDKEGREKVVESERLKVEKKEFKFEENKNPVILEVKDMFTHFPIKGGIFGRTVDHVKAVDGVSFTLRKGKTLGLVGESGCGKTTLGRSILRLIEPTSGQVNYAGKDITGMGKEEMRQMRSKMQIIFQDPYSSLNPRMTVADILLEPMKIHNVEANKTARLDRAKYLLDKVGLKTSQLNRYPHEFSGGQRQRICIARALSLKPEFIVCDESVSALDVSVQAQVLNLLLDLKEEMGLTYLFISHDLSVIHFFADEVAVMNNGKIIEYGDSSKIYHSPQEEYTKTLLSAIPKGKAAV